MKILLGLTGSVATTLADKLVVQLIKHFDAQVRVVMTERACNFIWPPKLIDAGVDHIYKEKHEWEWFDGDYSPKRPIWRKDDPVLHIELRKWADVLLIAPLTANTLAKMANGICNNLLMSIVRAWDLNRPVIVAPAMNTNMWEHPYTAQHLGAIRQLGVHVVPPIKKMLACGDYGDGALADIADICKYIREATQWVFPVANCNGIPVENHPGAFGAIRKYDRHCGVDLYCEPNSTVTAVEPGKIVAIEPFTGAKANCPWWLDTMAVKIEGSSGVVCYGEIRPVHWLEVGRHVKAEELIGNVIPVLPEHKLRKDIPGHSVTMLHMQLYERGMLYKDDAWKLDGKCPDGVLDPTKRLLESKPRGFESLAIDCGIKPLTMKP